MSKKRLNAEEREGLSDVYISAADAYLRKGNAEPVPPQEVGSVFELYILGYPLEDIVQRFPKYSLGQIAYTAALHRWNRDKNMVAASVYDRIRTRIIRSTVEQIEFLTDLISVTSTESSEEIKQYLNDPKNSPKPAMRISDIEEYQQVVKMLDQVTKNVKIVAPPAEDVPKEKRISSLSKKALPKVEEASDILADLAEGEDK